MGFIFGVYPGVLMCHEDLIAVYLGRKLAFAIKDHSTIATNGLPSLLFIVSYFVRQNIDTKVF